jgi:SAM-dependent methyltransferase
MGIKLERQKERSILASVVYRLKKLPLSRDRKLKLFLDLEWIFERLAHEESYNHYDPDKHPMRREGVDYILRFIKPEYSVLDLGCSRGEITRRVAEKAKSVVGVDQNAEAIAAAKEHERDNLQFFHGDARDFLTGSSERFDVLILSHILEHLDDPEEFLRQFKDDFRYIYVEVPDFDKTIFNHLRQDLKMSLVYTDADHVNEFDRQQILDMLAAVDLRVLQSEHRLGVQRYWCENGRHH